MIALLLPSVNFGLEQAEIGNDLNTVGSEGSVGLTQMRGSSKVSCKSNRVKRYERTCDSIGLLPVFVGQPDQLYAN